MTLASWLKMNWDSVSLIFVHGWRWGGGAGAGGECGGGGGGGGRGGDGWGGRLNVVVNVVAVVVVAAVVMAQPSWILKSAPDWSKICKRHIAYVN